MAADPAAFAHAHNLLLDVWLQLGLVGVLLSLWLVVSLVRRCLRYARIDYSCTLIASCFLTLLFAFSLRCASDDLFIYAMSSTFWILCGVMLGLEADVAHDGQLMSRLGQLVRGPGSKVSKVIPP
jgi:O-antigen ligase